MTDPGRYTLLTVTIKFTLPTSVPDNVAKEAHDTIKAWAANYLGTDAVDEAMGEHLADLEIAPNEPLDAALDIGSLKVESDA
jgi:hypothetical protein